jgi:protein-disulfide isomerase
MEGDLSQIEVAHRALVVVLLALMAPFFVAGAEAQQAQTLEVVIGAEDAPVTVIEYMSLTCSHCANFHINTLPDVMKHYVNTGKVRLIFRDYPLDGTAYRAAIVTHCMAEAGSKRYYGFVQILFQQQQRWATAPDPLAEVAKLARIGGMNQQSFDACQENEAYASGVLLARTQGEAEYDIQSTPTFVIDGRVVPGGMSYEEFSRAVDPLIN